MAERELAIIVRAKDFASRTMKGITREGQKMNKTLSKGAGHAADTLKTLGVVSAGVAAVGLAASVKAAADFESQMNTINTVAGETPEHLKAIGDGIRQIARDTGTPLADLTAGFYDLVSAGIAANQAQKVLAASNKLAIGGLATAAESVDLLTTALNSYGVSAKNQGKESERFADIFAKAIEKGKLKASDLAESFASVAPLAASMKIEIEEVAAGYANMTAKGVPAAEAATQMASALVALQRKTGPLKKLEKQTGRNYAAIAGRKGLAVAFDIMAKDAAKAGVPLIELVGRKEALQFALLNTGKAMKGYNENLAAMQNAEGTAARQMGEREKGLNFQLDRLKALARDAGITIGSKLLPSLTPLAEKAVKFLDTHQGDIEKFGDEIARAFKKAVIWAQRIPWGAVADGLKTAAGLAGDLIDAFANAPTEVKGLIIALAGLDKLTGGISIDIGKTLIGGAFGQFFARGTSPANPMWVASTTGGVPGAGAGGAAAAGGGSILKTVLSTALKGLGVILAAEIADEIHNAIKPPSTATSELSWPWGPKNTPKILPNLGIPGLLKLTGENGILGGTPTITEELKKSRSNNDRDAQQAEQQRARQIRAVEAAKAAAARAAQEEHGRGERLITSERATKAAVDASKVRLAAAERETARETNRGLNATAAASRRGLANVAETVRRKNLSVKVNNYATLNLSIRATQSKMSFSQKMAVYG